MASVEEQYGDDIYRPGEDLTNWEEMTTDEQEAMRAEIERIFREGDHVVEPPDEE